MSNEQTNIPRIAIIGGGVASLALATKLGRWLGRRRKAEIVLVDRNSAHVCKPMLHTFAAGTSTVYQETPLTPGLSQRPTMRTVAVKTSEQQACALLFRARDLLVSQRTQMVNALRGHLGEHGIIVRKGLGNVERLATLITSENLPELMQTMSRLYRLSLWPTKRRASHGRS